MNDDVVKDWAWADRFLPAIGRILQLNASGIVNFKIAPPDEDMEQATDIVLDTIRGQIAVRVRRDDCSFRDLTIRSRRSSGSETELSKIKRGFARWYLYCWVGEQDEIGDWILVDLDRLRETHLLEKPRDEKRNKDGQTWFIYINYKELIHHNCLTAYKLGETSKTALPAGIFDELDRLKTENARLFGIVKNHDRRKHELAKTIRDELRQELNLQKEQIQTLIMMVGQLFSDDDYQMAFLNVSGKKPEKKSNGDS